jgi:hypothetical protein
MGRSGSTFAKRQKEIAQQERARDKLARRSTRKEEKDARPASLDGVDPDIAGIVPGPQPVIED